MFLKRNRSRQGGRKYQSILLVQGKRVPAKRPPGRPRADAPPRRTVVVHETLANLSKLPPELVELIDAWCRGQAPEAAAAVHVGPCYGRLAGRHARARELGLVRAVGEATRTQRLAWYLVYARVAFQGSRLSAVRAAEDHAVREIFLVGSFDEDDLYAALDYLAEHQAAIERAWAPPVPPGAVFPYDVTSVYFEREQNELAVFGDNRDGKKGKRQLVAGLLTDGEGEPLAIELYPGNPSDPPTFPDAVRRLQERFGAEAIALAGDRGMIKVLGKAALAAANFRHVTALTRPQIRRLVRRGGLQMELFEEEPSRKSGKGANAVCCGATRPPGSGNGPAGRTNGRGCGSGLRRATRRCERDRGAIRKARCDRRRRGWHGIGWRHG